MTTRDDCVELDLADPLGRVRDRFALPAGTVYLAGNSLGPPTVHSTERLTDFASLQWGHHLVAGWRNDGWMDAPLQLGRQLALRLGASPGEVVVCDSTTVNIYKLLHAAVRMRPDRRVIVAADEDFPTDSYLVDSVAASAGLQVRRLAPAAMASADHGDVAVVVCSHVHFRTAEVHDMATITTAAHAGGALVLWDLSHSAGVVPVQLTALDVDLAVGCTYKYLNGGPGAPAYCFVAERHHESLSNPLTGWLGHAVPFGFEPTYRPAAGLQRLVTGTPSVPAYVALATALDATADADIEVLHRKAMALGELFVGEVRRRLGEQVRMVSPVDPTRRGGHVALAHACGYEIVQALIARGVIGDFRAPDVMRFAFSPSFQRYTDAFDAAYHLAEVIHGEEYRDPSFAVRQTVT